MRATSRGDVGREFWTPGLKNRKIHFLKAQSTAAAVIRMYKRAIVTLIRSTVALHLKRHRQRTSSKVQLSKSEE